MTFAAAEFSADSLFGLPRHPLVVEEAGIELHLQPDHDAQAVSLRAIQKPARRHVVGPDGVEPAARDQFQIALDNIRAGVDVAIRRGTKRSVRHGALKELLVADPNK